MAKNLIQNCCELVNTTPASGTEQVANPFGLVLIKKASFTTSAGPIQFTGLASYPYADYKIKANIFSTSSFQAQLQLSSDNGVTYHLTAYTGQVTYFAGANVTAISGTGNFVTGMLLNASTGSTQITAIADLFNMNSSAASISMFGQGMSMVAAGDNLVQYSMLQSVYNNLIVANAFQIALSAACTGVIELYGYN